MKDPKSCRGSRQSSYVIIGSLYYVTHYSINNSGSVGTMWNTTLVQLLTIVMIL